MNAPSGLKILQFTFKPQNTLFSKKTAYLFLVNVWYYILNKFLCQYFRCITFRKTIKKFSLRKLSHRKCILITIFFYHFFGFIYLKSVIHPLILQFNKSKPTGCYLLSCLSSVLRLYYFLYMLRRIDI